MKKILLIISFSFLLLNCKDKPKEKVELKKPYDESYIVVRDYRELGYSKDTAKVSLNAHEINKIDLLLKAAIKDYNTDTEKHFVIGNHKPADLNLKDYKRQYFPSLNRKGEKEVDIHCFCDTEREDWKTRSLFSILGGGDCYFRVRVNLSKNEFFDFSPNGPA